MKKSNIEIKTCYKCKSANLKPKKNLITLGNKFSEINVLECQKCGETYSSMDETERVRKVLHPSFLSRISNLFNSLINHSKNMSIFKDKIL